METKSHNFELTTFSSPVWCDICTKFIWGLKEQGFKCSACHTIAHNHCRSGSLQCSAVKQTKKQTSGGGNLFLDAQELKNSKEGGIYQIEVLGTVPVCHWCYRENDLWWPYDDETSDKIEELFKKAKTKGETKAKLDDLVFDFEKLKSKKEGASKDKWLNRGIWFYTDDDSVVRPYTVDIGNKLEQTYLEFEKSNQTETGNFEVQVDEKPPRVVRSVPGTNMTEFKQVRSTPSANPEGRLTLRGFKGKVLFRCFAELK